MFGQKGVEGPKHEAKSNKQQNRERKKKREEETLFFFLLSFTVELAFFFFFFLWCYEEEDGEEELVNKSGFSFCMRAAWSGEMISSMERLWIVEPRIRLILSSTAIGFSFS